MGDTSLPNVNDVIAVCAKCWSCVPCEGSTLCDICKGPEPRQVLCFQTQQFVRPPEMFSVVNLNCDGKVELPGQCLLNTIAHAFFGGVELALRLKAVIEANMLRTLSLSSAPETFLCVCAAMFRVYVQIFSQSNIGIGCRTISPTEQGSFPTVSISQRGDHFRPFAGGRQEDHEERRQRLAELEQVTQVIVTTMPVPVVAQLPPPPPPPPPQPSSSSSSSSSSSVQLNRITRANLDPPLSICAMFRSSDGVVLICRLSHNVCRTASNIRLQINNPAPLDVTMSSVTGNLVRLDTVGTFLEFVLDRFFANADTISASVFIGNTIIGTRLWSYANAAAFKGQRDAWRCANTLLDWANYKCFFADNYSVDSANDELVEDGIYWFTRADSAHPCSLIRADPGFFATDREWMNTAENSEHVIYVWRNPIRSEFAYRLGCSRTRTNQRRLKDLSAELLRLNMVNPPIRKKGN